MDTYQTPRAVALRNAVVLGTVVLGTFVALRLWLWLVPNADFDVAGYNVHHLFTGLVFIVAGGIPLAVFRGNTRRLDIALVLFGIGLGLTLDEWVYLIATDGSNASYLLPISFRRGGIGSGVRHPVGMVRPSAETGMTW
ncbi:MAG: hypothetical protein V3T16_10280 [Gemmatimonadales bacterium]